MEGGSFAAFDIGVMLRFAARDMLQADPAFEANICRAALVFLAHDTMLALRLQLPVQLSNCGAGDHSRVSGPNSGFAKNHTARVTDMIDASSSRTDPVLVAIGIAKSRYEILLSIPGKKRRRRLTV